MQRKSNKIALCNFQDTRKIYKWAPFRLPLLPLNEQVPSSLKQVSICQNDIDSSIIYILLLTEVPKKEEYILFINRLQIIEDQGLKVNQTMIGKFRPDRETMKNGLQGLSSNCIGGFIYLFFNLGSKSKNCACVIDVSSLERDEDAYNDASPHVFKIISEVPNKAIPEGLVFDYSIHTAKKQSKIIFFGGLNEQLNPLSGLLCFDLNVQEFVPYKSFNDDPKKRYGHTGVVINDEELIIFGGSCDQSQNLTIDPDPLDKQNSCELNILNIEGQQWGRIETRGVGTPGYLVGAKAVAFLRQKDVAGRSEEEEVKNWNIATLWHTRGLKAQEYKVSMLNLETNRWVCLNIEGTKLALPHNLSLPLITKEFCLVFDLSPLELVQSESGKKWRQWTMWVLRQAQETKEVEKPNFAKLTTITSKFQKEIMNEEAESSESEGNDLTFEELLAIEKKKIQEEELKKEKLKEKKKRKKLAKQQKLQEQKETKK